MLAIGYLSRLLLGFRYHTDPWPLTKTDWAARSARERKESLPILTADAPGNGHNREKGDRRGGGGGGGGEVVSSSSVGAMFGLVAFHAFSPRIQNRDR